MESVQVRYMDLGRVHGCVTRNEDGSFTIFLNSRDTREKNQETYYHELSHIRNYDTIVEVAGEELRARREYAKDNSKDL